MPKMPVKEVEIPLDGDYAGFQFTVRANMSAGEVDELLAAAETKNRIVIREAYAKVVRSWNFGDENGEPMGPPSAETFAKLPDELVWEMVSKTTEALTSPPKPPSGS